jgi:hypothetical protein
MQWRTVKTTLEDMERGSAGKGVNLYQDYRAEGGNARDYLDEAMADIQTGLEKENSALVALGLHKIKMYKDSL